jgi:ATPase subunit of ABC transporter with duplicated ATPase domains
MCLPAIPIAMQLAIAAASAAATYSSQSRAANAQERSIRQAGDLQQMDLTRQRDQQGEAAAQEANEHARSAARDAALFETVAGEYGGGNTADRASSVADIRTQERLATVGRNAELASQENSMATLASRHNTNARLASIQQPSKVGAALSIAGAAAGAYQQGAFGGSGAGKKPPASGGAVNGSGLHYTPKRNLA